MMVSGTKRPPYGPKWPDASGRPAMGRYDSTKFEGLSVGFFAVVCRLHVHDSFIIVDFVKESPISYPISICVGFVSFQFSYVRSEMWVASKNGVNVFHEFDHCFSQANFCNVLNVFPELWCFRNSVFPATRQNDPSRGLLPKRPS